MSALLKAAIATGSGLTLAAIGSSIMRSDKDFSSVALQASELDITKTKDSKPRLPSEFFSFTLKDFKLSNAA